jgi:hypothetical protein
VSCDRLVDLDSLTNFDGQQTFVFTWQTRVQLRLYLSAVNSIFSSSIVLLPLSVELICFSVFRNKKILTTNLVHEHNKRKLYIRSHVNGSN